MARTPGHGRPSWAGAGAGKAEATEEWERKKAGESKSEENEAQVFVRNDLAFDVFDFEIQWFHLIEDVVA